MKSNIVYKGETKRLNIRGWSIAYINLTFPFLFLWMDNRNNPFGLKLVLSEVQVVCRAGGRHSYGVRLPALPTKWSLCGTGSQHDLVAALYQLPPANFSKFLERNFCPHSWINEGSATVDDALKTVEKGVTWGMDMFCPLLPPRSWPVQHPTPRKKWRNYALIFLRRLI